MRIILALTILAIIIESVFYPYPFTLLAVIMAVLGLGLSGLKYAFFTGLVLDIFMLRPLGSDSIIFLILAVVLIRYNRKIYAGNYLYVMVFLLLTVSFYSLIFYQKYFQISFILLTIVFGFWQLFLLSYIFPSTIGEKKKLIV